MKCDVHTCVNEVTLSTDKFCALHNWRKFRNGEETDLSKCNYCAGTMVNHVPGCIMLHEDKGTHLITSKEYKAPELLQLRLEAHVAQAATKWFELEKHYESIPKKTTNLDMLKVYESLGEKAVLLLKKE